MALRARAFVILAEDLAAYYHPLLQFQGIWYSLLASVGSWTHTYATHKFM